jgi:hypothetical protein
VQRQLQNAEKAYQYAEDAMCKLYCSCKADKAYIDSLTVDAGDATSQNFTFKRTKGQQLF